MLIDPKYLALPLLTLIAYSTAYSAHFLANLGRVNQLKPLAITFSLILFITLYTLLYRLISGLAEEVGSAGFAATASLLYIYAIILPIVIVVSVGLIWQKVGRDFFYNQILRRMDISHSDNTVSAWQALQMDTQSRYDEVIVTLKNGKVLASRELSQFDKLPNGPFTLGENGDVLLYVTHECSADSDHFRQVEGVLNENYGNLATWITSSEIEKIQIRRQ